MADNNSVIIDKVFKGTNAYQLGAPNPTQVGIAKSMRWINDPMNSEWRMKTFIPQLFALIGTQIVHSKEWTNPLAQFKRANISNMKAIEEIMARLIKGRTYMQEMQGNLLEYNPPEVETAIHTVNRKVQYPITYNPQELENAFLSEQGLSNFFSAVMQVPINSDNRDEYEMMKDLIAKYQDKWGFYMVSVSEHSPEEATKDDIMNLLENIRAYADKLKFYTGLYNAYNIEVFTPKDQLLVMMTPEVKAKMDVQALAAAFNVAFAEIESRIILVDEMPIPDCYALLMDENWFICGDALLQTTNFFNGATLNTNYWLHHWEVLSMSPMMNAIAFMKNSATQVETVTVTPYKYSNQHRISATPFYQDGTTDQILFDGEDNGTTDIKDDIDYISGDEEFLPQKYHNLNGLLYFNANPNKPGYPVESYKGNYVFKPATFEMGAVKETIQLKDKSGAKPVGLYWMRDCDCYKPLTLGKVAEVKTNDDTIDLTAYNASTLIEKLKNAYDNFTNEQFMNEVKKCSSIYLYSDEYNSDRYMVRVGYDKTNGSVIVGLYDYITNTFISESFTKYQYNTTNHTLGKATTQGWFKITISDGTAFEARFDAQSNIINYEGNTYNGLNVPGKFHNVYNDKYAKSIADIYDMKVISSTVLEDAKVSVDDFGRLEADLGDVEVVSFGGASNNQFDRVYITGKGATTYNSDGFEDNAYTNAPIKVIDYLTKDTYIADVYGDILSR